MSAFPDITPPDPPRGKLREDERQIAQEIFVRRMALPEFHEQKDFLSHARNALQAAAAFVDVADEEYRERIKELRAVGDIQDAADGPMRVTIRGSEEKGDYPAITRPCEMGGNNPMRASG